MQSTQNYRTNNVGKPFATSNHNDQLVIQTLTTKTVQTITGIYTNDDHDNEDDAIDGTCVCWLRHVRNETGEGIPGWGEGMPHTRSEDYTTTSTNKQTLFKMVYRTTRNG